MTSHPHLEALTTWWELLFKDNGHLFDSESHGLLLMEGGAEVVNHLSEDHLQVFVLESEKNHLLRLAEDQGLTLLEEKKVRERNWVQTCEDLLVPEKIENLTIVPVTDVTTRAANSDILIVPGSGFGTGHHESTKNALVLLQHPLVAASAPRRVLDVGTGSGILSIAVAKLYGADAYGTDIDPLALQNARENIRLNEVEDKIQLVQEELPAEEGFDLVLANIYAEILCRFEPKIHQLLRPHGYLIVSGIMPSLLHEVRKGYSEERWELHVQLDKGEWCTLLLSRRP